MKRLATARTKIGGHIRPTEQVRIAERMVAKAMRFGRRKARKLVGYYGKEASRKADMLKSYNGSIDPRKRNKAIGTVKRYAQNRIKESMADYDKATVRAMRRHIRPVARLAEYDQETGLLKKTEFNRHLMALCAHHNPIRPFAVTVIDINYLKQANDKFGHDEGDRLLRSLSKALKTMEHKGNIKNAARTGGDEFCIVIPIAEPEKAKETIAKSVSTLREVFQRNWEEVRSDIPASFAAGSAISNEVVPHSMLRRKGAIIVKSGSAKVMARSLVKVADERMYVEKERMHEPAKSKQAADMG